MTRGQSYSLRICVKSSFDPGFPCEVSPWDINFVGIDEAEYF